MGNVTIIGIDSSPQVRFEEIKRGEFFVINSVLYQKTDHPAGWVGVQVSRGTSRVFNANDMVFRAKVEIKVEVVK